MILYVLYLPKVITYLWSQHYYFRQVLLYITTKTRDKGNEASGSYATLFF
jgi:hypothetical protein